MHCRMAPSDNIGRVAQLFGLTSQPELNDSYVVLESYDAVANEFAVKALPAPNAGAGEATLRVNLSDLRFPVTDTFMSRYPNGPTCPGKFFRSQYYEPGTILDFSEVRRETHILGMPLAEALGGEEIRSAFHRSCLVRGLESSPAHFQDKTVIFPDDPKAPIEFRYCNFTGQAHCVRGTNVVLRNCRIGGDLGFQVGQIEPAHVVFENCVFEDSDEMSLKVKEHSRVTLLNCSFRNCRNAVELAEGASALIVHCTFVDTSSCIAMRSKGGKLDVVNCSFDGALSGVFARCGGNVCVKGCKFRNGTLHSINVEGPKDTSLHVEDCVITDCKAGISVNVGNVHFTMVNTQITRCHFYGVLLGQGLLGSMATFTNCRIVGNERSDLLNVCDQNSLVVTDGVPYRTDKRDYEVRAKRAELIQKDLQAYVKEEHGDFRVALKRLRKVKNTGIMCVVCENCSTPEPLEEKFKSCGKCKNVVYCTKECQVANWKEHKKTCCITECA